MTASLTNRLFPALAEASLRRYLSGQIASVLGSWTQNVTLNLLVYHTCRAPPRSSRYSISCSTAPS